MRSPARPLVLAAALATVLGTGLAGCGSGGGDGTTKAAPATTTVAQQATGLNFTVQVPPRWTDVEDQLNVGDTRYDVAAADTTAKGFKKNVTVDRASGQQLAGQSLAKLDAAAREGAKGSGVTVVEGAPITLDGQPAKEAIITRRQDGQRLTAYTVLSLYKGELYSIRLVSQAGDPGAEKILRTMLGTWHWTD